MVSDLNREKITIKEEITTMVEELATGGVDLEATA